MNLKITGVAALLLAGAICSVALAGEIEKMHREAAAAKKAAAGDGQAARPRNESRSGKEISSKDHGITEIGLERTPCYGTCPVYTVIIQSDGTFKYHGERNVERKGDFTGKVSPYELNCLAQFIRDSRYAEMQDSYSWPVTDNPTVYTTVVMNGKRKVISNYANGGPTKLWAIEQLIDKLLCDAKWEATGL